jgi:hypothetical protein
LQEQHRADSLLKAKLVADAEITSLRASMQDKEKQLQQLNQTLAAAGVASPLQSIQQPAVAESPASADLKQPQKQSYMSESEQRLWEEQQRSIRCRALRRAQSAAATFRIRSFQHSSSSSEF